MLPLQTVKAKFESRFKSSQEKFPNRDYTKIKDYVFNSEFFSSPAAKGHHNNFPSGLAQHVLNFTYALETLVQSFDGRFKVSSDQYDPFLVAIGHDLNKVGFYTITDLNRKVGDKWYNLKQYGYDSYKDMMPGANISLGMISRNIELTMAESLSIYWAEGSWSTYSNQTLDKAWKNAMNYDGRVYLSHTADMISSQMMEVTLNEFDVDKAIRNFIK